MQTDSLSVEQKKAALLARFSPYIEQDIYCRRVVEYLWSASCSTMVIADMWKKLEEIHHKRNESQKLKNNKIITKAKQVESVESQEAEKLLLSL